MPICLDLGTITQKHLDDPFYMGIRVKRVSDQEMQEIMDEFMSENDHCFPKNNDPFEVSKNVLHVTLIAQQIRVALN